MYFSKIILLTLFSFGLFFGFNQATAQELIPEDKGVVRAQVLEILKEGTREIEGLDRDQPIITPYQVIKVKILEGDELGKEVEIENDYLIFKEGAKFFLGYLKIPGEDTLYSVVDPDRRWALVALFVFFVLVLALFSGWQGVRALVSLAGGFLIIIYVLLPALLLGYSPLLVSSVVAIGVLLVAIVVTHGLNRESISALVGCVVAIILTALLAYISVLVTQLTGMSSDESTYLNFDTGGRLEFQGLLLAAIIIGVVGVLDDIAVTQAAVVSELHRADRSLSRLEIYKRAVRIGREHVSALVNTLVFAYTSAALPLLLLFTNAGSSLALLINREMFAVEIVRTLVGSIGLILTVPLATLAAVYLLYGHLSDVESGVHKHHHSH